MNPVRNHQKEGIRSKLNVPGHSEAKTYNTYKNGAGATMYAQTYCAYVLTHAHTVHT